MDTWHEVCSGVMVMVLVYAYVCGDILHKGHIEYLRNAKALGDKLIVGVLTDEAVMEKKACPTMDFHQRFDLVRNIEWVDAAVAQHTYSPEDNVRDILPDILVESSDHANQPANAFIEAIGGRVVAMPYYPDHSSTQIKDSIRGKK